MAYCAMPNPMCTDMPCPADQLLQIPQAYQQVWSSPANSMSPVTPAQSMMLFLPSAPVNPMAQVNQPDMLPWQRSYSRSNSGGSPSDVLLTPSSEFSQRSSKGPISKLQEFVQSSKVHPLPSSCAVLQWSHENRMAGSSLQFREPQLSCSMVCHITSWAAGGHPRSKLSETLQNELYHSLLVCVVRK